MKGTSCGMLQKTTSLVQPKPPLSAVALAVSRIWRPMRAAASMLIPARELAMLIEEQTRSVVARASGMASISALSPWAKPFSTRAEKPPRKSTPASWAASSRAWHMRTMPSGPKGPPTTAMGLTLRSFARILPMKRSRSWLTQSKRLTPSVTVRTSRCSLRTISRVLMISLSESI